MSRLRCGSNPFAIGIASGSGLLTTDQRAYSPAELVEAGNILNQNYAGLTFEDVKQRVREELKQLHEDMTLLPHAASSVVAVAVLIAAWGYFIGANRAAEDVEPEAMDQAKDEDRKLD